MTRPRNLPLRAVGALALSSALMTAGCATDSGETETTGGYDLVTEGKLTTCTHLPYAPFQLERSGKVVGFDVDMVDLVAKELGVKQEIVDTPFEGIKSGADLKTGKCDIAAAAMTITPERQKAMAFSDPYFAATQSLVTKKGSGLDGFDAMKGKKLAVQSGTTGEIYAKEHAEPKGVTLVTFEDLGTELSALQSGQVDAAINDFPVLTNWLETHQGYEISTQFDTGENYGFGMAKGRDDKLVATVDKVLARAKKDGTYDEIYRKWFGEAPPK
ncbi:MAG: basic amino acid ABC transporter substrate-binding protein [Actinomycetes bacterium]